MSQLALLPINCEFALATVGLYDYCLTLDHEIRQVWQRKTSWVSILFYVNRYSIIATSIVIFIKDARIIVPTDKECTNLVLAQIVLDVTLTICAACFFAAQMYALYGRPTVLLAFTSVVAAASPIISIYVWAKAATISLSTGQLGERCSSLFALENGAFESELIASRACNLAANCLVLAMIIYKTVRLNGSDLGFTIVKQGALFFIAIATPNIVGLCLGNNPLLGANIPLHIDSATSILISRFIMTLRRRYGDEVSQQSRSKGPTDIVFREPWAVTTSCIYSTL